MTTTLVPGKRVEVIRQETRTDAHAKEHGTFSIMSDQMSAELPIIQLKLAACTHGPTCRDCRRKNLRLIVSAMDASVKKIRSIYEDMRQVFTAIAEAHVWTGVGDTSGKLRAEKLEEVVKSLPTEEREIPDTAFAELMAREETEILKICQETFTEGIGRVIERLHSRLVKMQSMRIVSKINWFGRDACS